MNGSSLPALPCLCGTLRRGARALTLIYEQALRPLGMTSTQFTVLQVLDRAAEVSQGQLGAMLAMDSTTLTRTLKILTRHRWIAERRGDDRRERRLRLARAGRLQLQRALPLWQAVQWRLRRQLGSPAWGELIALANQVTAFASPEQDQVSNPGGSL